MTYYVAHEGGEVYYGASAIAALAALAALPTLTGAPLVITYDGSAYRGHSVHELKWDAIAERAGMAD